MIWHSQFFKRICMRYQLGLFTLASSFLLSGCTTLFLMESIKFDNSYRRTKEKDTLVAFGRTKENSKDMPANQFLMLGQKYVYLITQSQYDIQGRQSANNEKLANILNAKLSRPFEISTGENSSNKGYFPVDLDKDTQKFSSYFCLNYHANTALSKQEQALEQKTLDNLQFLTHKDGRRYLCMTINGKAYSKPDNMVYQHRFKNPVPIQLNVAYEGINTAPALRVLGLPFAVVTDIVTLPVQALLYATLSTAKW